MQDLFMQLKMVVLGLKMLLSGGMCVYLISMTDRSDLLYKITWSVMITVVQFIVVREINLYKRHLRHELRANLVMWTAVMLAVGLLDSIFVTLSIPTVTVYVIVLGLDLWLLVEAAKYAPAASKKNHLQKAIYLFALILTFLPVFWAIFTYLPR